MWKPSSGQNYYLVVGAFATENDDIREITSYLPGTSADTSYSIRQNQNLLHFYVLKTSNKEVALAKTLKLQQEMASSENGSLVSAEMHRGKAEITLPETTHPSGELIEPSVLTASAEKSGDGGVSPVAAPPAKPKGQYFKFTITKPDGTTLPADLHHVDLEEERELGTFSSGSYIDVLRPGKEVPMTIVCGVFGYREVEKYIDYSDPSATEGAFLDEYGAWVIPYSLERLEKGDVSVMYNVSFYKDAVMMQPASKTNLDELVDMMITNSNYVIKVHAHCNGRNRREISIPAGPQEYFNPQGSIIKEGSAKELTNLRSEAIRTYLVEHGIDESRIKTYGWGATEMLVDKNSPYAQLNDRIEIEILRD